jgi:ribonuclease BN (tRNA processing enzyme)
VNAHEVEAGVVYKDANVTVTAFPVPHGSWKYSFGYKFVTRDRTIVVTGDTRPSETIVKACNGCDALISELYTERGYAESDTVWQKYVRSFHISTKELGALATRAKPKLLILTHQMWFGRANDNEQTMIAELKQYYKGRIASAHDLEVF